MNTQSNMEHFLSVPPNIDRAVILSNLDTYDARQVLDENDWAIHLNTAKHKYEAYDVWGVRHGLIVRHINEKNGIRWCGPDSYFGFWHVLFWHGNLMKRDWLTEYVEKTNGKWPTTGFVAYHLAKEEFNGPIVLVGFKPREDIGTKWDGHAWDYEADYYEKNGVTIINP